MKVTCKVITVVALCAGLTQIVRAETIKIAKQNPVTYTFPWSYKLITKTTEASEPVESKATTFNKKNANITFNGQDYEVMVQVITNSSSDKVLFKKGTYTPYKQSGILVGVDGKVSLRNLDEAFFAATHKVPVQKEKIDIKKWTIRADAELLPDKENYFRYDQIEIRNSTNKGKGLTVPKNKGFVLLVQTKPDADWVITPFSAEQARSLKKIKLNAEGKATPA